jgi:DNA-binding transcriptional LysR family regulator
MGTGQYYLAYPPDRATYPPLAVFRDWISREIEADHLRSPALSANSP